MKAYRLSFNKWAFCIGLLLGGSYPLHIVSAAFAFGGGGGDDGKKDKCDEAKEEKEKECSDGKETKLCQEAREKKKKECHEETEEKQDKGEEEKAEDTSAADSQALSAIDGHYAKLVQVQDQALQALHKAQEIYNQLLADSKNPCLKPSDWSNSDKTGKKDVAVAAVAKLKTDADAQLGDKVDLINSSIDDVMKQIANEVPKVSNESLKSTAQGKADAASNLAKKGRDYINQFNDTKAKIENMSLTPEGTCSTSPSRANPSTSTNTPGE